MRAAVNPKNEAGFGMRAAANPNYEGKRDSDDA